MLLLKGDAAVQYLKTTDAMQSVFHIGAIVSAVGFLALVLIELGIIYKCRRTAGGQASK
jgi:hypothetical protein